MSNPFSNITSGNGTTLSLNPEETGFDTIPKDQLTFGSINPVEGDELSPPEPLIDRSTAEQYLHDLPTATPADQWRMRRSLSAFRDEALRQRRAAEDEHIEKLVTDEGYQNHLMNTPEFVTATQYQSEPDGLKNEAVTRAYLAHSLGRPIKELEGDGVADAFRDAYALRYFGKATVTNSEFVGLVKGQYKARDTAREAIKQLPGSLTEAIFQDLEAGSTTSISQIVQKWEAANPGAIRPEYRAQLLAAAPGFVQENEPWMRRFGPTARMIFNALAPQTGVEIDGKPVKPTEGPTKEQAIEALLAIPRDDRLKAYQIGGLYSTQIGDPKGYAQQLGETVSRSVT